MSYSRGGEDSPSKEVSYLPVRPSRHTGLLEYIKSVKDSNDSHDLELISRGRRFRVHKLVLAGQSRYFREALASNKTVPTLTLDFDADMLSICIDYLYNGTVEVDTRHAAELGSLSDQLGLDNLKYDCCYYEVTSQDLTIDNCISKWEVACAVGGRDLVLRARSMVLDNFDSLSSSSAFLMLPLDRVQIFLSHPDLRVRAPEDRLTSALEWVQYDPDSRSKQLITLLNVLPLDKISPKFLKYTLRVDPILKSHQQASWLFSAKITGVRHPQHCALILGTRRKTGSVAQPATRDVYAVATSGEYPVYTRAIPELPAPLHRDGNVACCMDGNTLITSGLGNGLNGAWKHDFKEGGWRECAPLNAPRNRHCMCVHEGDVYVLGGGPNPDVPTLQNSVEVMVNGCSHWQLAGMLVGSVCNNTICCLLGEKDILVFGVEDKQKHTTLQVYSTVSQTVTHTLSLPSGQQRVYGVVVAGGYVIMMAQHNTYVCSVSSIYGDVYSYKHLQPHRVGYAFERNKDIREMSLYKTPNVMCAVALTDDLSHVILVGGEPRKDSSPFTSDRKSPHYMYRAKVSAIVGDRGGSWERLQASWPVGECLILGGAVCTGPSPRSLRQ